MVDALWVQGVSGVDYSAAEDRHLITAMFTQGVIGTGLVITAGVGYQAAVSAGFAAIPDGSGGTYLAYFDAAQVCGLTGNTVNNIWIQVNTTTGQSQIVATTGSSVPAFPAVSLGTATTGGSNVTSCTNPPTRQGALRVGNYLSKLATDDTTAVPIGGLWGFTQAIDFKAGVTLEQGAAWAGGGPVQKPAGIYYRSGVGFKQTVYRDSGTGQWQTLGILRDSGAPNTATYGNFIGVGAYAGMMVPANNTLVAPEAGFYTLSALVSFILNAGTAALTTTTGAVGVRAYAISGKAGRNLLAQTYQPVFEDHSGSSMLAELSWAGWLAANTTIVVQANAYTADVLASDYLEIHWAKQTGLIGGAVGSP